MGLCLAHGKSIFDRIVEVHHKLLEARDIGRSRDDELHRYHLAHLDLAYEVPVP